MTVTPVDKKKIRNAFSKAAATYEKWADVQNVLEDRLLAKIEGRNYTNILEIGCGTGRMTSKLAVLHPGAKIFALDLAPGMLERARHRLLAYKQVSLLEADGEDLPDTIINKAPFDLIVSSATFQWFTDLKGALGRYSTILSQRGDMVFSIFGPSTLAELQTALALADHAESVLVSSLFPGKDELLAIASPIFGFCDLEELIIKKEYDSLMELLLSLKNTGVAVPLKKKPLIRTSSKLARVEREFLQRFGAITVTYQIFFITISR